MSPYEIWFKYTNQLKYIVIILFLCPTLLSADMVLNKSIIYFEPGRQNREDLEIQNVGDTPLYVQITPKIVRNPGTDEQVREVFDNPKEAGLLVSPNKLIVPPKGRKLLRFVNLNKNAQEERVYRVSVTPVVGNLSAKQPGVKLLIGYEVLVLVHPANGDFELVHERKAKRLTISNHGNQNVLLRKGTQCAPGVEDQALCTQITGKRLYPGNTWTTELEKDLPVTYFLSKGKEHTVQTFE